MPSSGTWAKIESEVSPPRTTGALAIEMEGIKPLFDYKAKKRRSYPSSALFCFDLCFVPKQVLAVHGSQMSRKNEMQPWPEDLL